MKKGILAILLILFLGGCSDNSSSNTNSSNTQRVSYNSPINNTSNEQTVNFVNIGNDTSNEIDYIENTVSSAPTEAEISNFTTEILTDDDKRENNIDITCSKINEYILKAGDTFSFTDTVGKATYDKGYEKADIFDANGNKTKGLGGGNCQVSSTLYNAVLEADGEFEIVERHPHSSKVYYVPDGKDATVAYGSLDFKFKNNNNFDVKIYASSTDEEVNVRLVKLTY